MITSLSVMRTGSTWPMYDHGTEYKLSRWRDVALDVDVAIDDLGGVEVAGRQRQQVRLFALMTLERRFLEVA